MKAFRPDPLSLLELRDKTGKRIPKTPLFKRFEAGLAWPHLLEQDHYAKHWIVVVGEQEDGVFSYFIEEGGDLDTVGKAMLRLKDRLLISRYHTTEEHLDSLAMLRDHEYFDGLSEYGSDGLDDDEFEMWHHNPDYWPDFRDRDTVAPIVVVDKEIQTNILDGIQLIRRLIKDGKAIIRRECQVFATVIQQRPPLTAIVNHPIVRAAVWVTGAMIRDNRTLEPGDEESPWYGNVRK